MSRIGLVERLWKGVAFFGEVRVCVWVETWIYLSEKWKSWSRLNQFQHESDQ